MRRIADRKAQRRYLGALRCAIADLAFDDEDSCRSAVAARRNDAVCGMAQTTSVRSATIAASVSVRE
jgi:hypothetical protein